MKLGRRFVVSAMATVMNRPAILRTKFALIGA
jgi:hypothetical protein